MKYVTEKYIDKVNMKFRPYSELIKINDEKEKEKEKSKCVILQEIKVLKSFIEAAILLSKFEDYHP